MNGQDQEEGSESRLLSVTAGGWAATLDRWTRQVTVSRDGRWVGLGRWDGDVGCIYDVDVPEALSVALANCIADVLEEEAEE